MGALGVLPVVDLHEDVSGYFFYHGGGSPLGDFAEDVVGREADLPKYRRGNVRVVFASMFPGVETFRPSESGALRELYGRWVPAVGYRVPQAVLWEHVSVYYKLSEAYGIGIVERFEDFEKCLAGGGVCFVLHLEGAEALDEPYDLVLLRRLGLRSLGLTWNYTNRYGAGCAARKDVGLTAEGEELVRLANRLGVVVDVAHASKRTALEAIEVSRKPVIASHANVRKLVDRPRNLDDEVLEALHRKGGVVGVSAIGPLVSSRARPSLEELVQHFTYIYETFGPDLLAIGTDFLGLLGLPAPEGFESIDKVQALLQALAGRGLSDRDIAKIAYENAGRVLRETMG
ncbi:MAG: membrane dipeptidase [Sulfolobales archaeon]|nr:membrane dipeptidase [Sulfolobales archaeon]MDW8010799.1 membrane dipeptidase [Sulfolobales archaeon]